MLFPEPLGPTTAVTELAGTARFNLLKIGTSGREGYVKWTSLNSIPPSKSADGGTSPPEKGDGNMQPLSLPSSKSTFSQHFNPFTPKRDQIQISPAASPVILHHTEWKTWLFLAYSDKKWLYYKFSLHHSYNRFLKGWENTLFELRSERVKRKHMRGVVRIGRINLKYEICHSQNASWRNQIALSTSPHTQPPPPRILEHRALCLKDTQLDYTGLHGTLPYEKVGDGRQKFVETSKRYGHGSNFFNPSKVAKHTGSETHVL